ncbi:hypothetical protein VKS41_008468 [Umbelopsis sp. WA50703]
MKAAVLSERKPELEVQEIADPILTPGSAIIKVLAAPVLPYLGGVLSGELPYPLVLPITPGTSGIGIVEEVGSDASNVKKGDLVFCDSCIRTRDQAHSPQTILQGLFCPEGQLSDVYRHGTLAEKVLTPLENVYVIPASLGTDAAKLTCINQQLVPYGGLLAGNFGPGQTLLLLGGTGHFGSCAIGVALAMGARKVVLPGRNMEKLAPLIEKFGNRVVAVQLTDNEEENIAAFKKAANASIDLVLELLGATAPQALLRAALLSLRSNGTGVIMSGRFDNLEFPFGPLMANALTIKGNFMYPRTAVNSLLSLMESGLINIDWFEVNGTFSLDDVNKGIKHAKDTVEAFKSTVVIP